MKRRTFFGSLALLCAAALLTSNAAGRADEGWIQLFPGKDLGLWKNPSEDWQYVGDVVLDPTNPKRLLGKEGTGVWWNGKKGRARDLYTKQDFGDLEVHVEFLIPKGSNAGVKLEGLYEIQIYDSWGVKTPKGSDCGGIYPRAEDTPKYHHIDEGIPPRVNACKEPGQWQTLDIRFQAPKFDDQGKKIANGKFVRVALNDVEIHKDVEVKTPTGSNYVKPEKAKGPLMLQADHGAVAFRNVRVKPY